MKQLNKILLFTVLLGTIYACSTKKDTVISRNYHALTSHFNILFNGEEAFKKGIEGINQGYKDDWFQQLPIEPIVFDDRKIVAPTFKNNSLGAGFGSKKEKTATTQPAGPFEKAEEKAVKAIQKHGMNINGLERNRKIDDAYLLLGKARYYSQRFVPAVEAFNYVIANYPNANLIAETKIWRAKANIRMDNEEFAIETMKLLLVVTDTLEADLPNDIKEQANTALAMAYVKSDSLQKAKKHLILATRTQENKAQAARNMFVLGQMYANENEKDSAAAVFNKLANFKKAPYKYKIHANIELAKNVVNDSISSSVLSRLEKLIEDRDNRPYLDQLYYQVASLHEKNDSIALAVDYYNRSLRAKNGGDKQKSFTYENLGNLYFKNSEYQFASSYYDSVLNVSTDSLALRIRRVKRKYKNLASLINFEDVVATNDSIIRIASLPKNEQESYFKNYIENLKKQDEEAAQLRLNQIAFGANSSSLQTNSKGEWYFYNNQVVSFGKTEFQKIWGNRKLEDNWRWSANASINTRNTDSVNVSKINTRYDLASYLETIPTEKQKIDTLKIDRNQALYELGLIYKEQFKNENLAIRRLERVLSLNPKAELVLPINWHLYQIYNKNGNLEKSNTHKNVILSEYPNTVFAQIIKNPENKIENKEVVNEVEKTYKKLYYLYKKGEFKNVLVNVNDVLPTINNSKLKPKFELLKAYAIGKYLDKETYKRALEFVAINYGSTEEGKKAKEILKQLTKE
ncbi:tetratricopeptide repeat protein [Polaribacter sp. KT 15]|uniref:type IX secretion system periplasmic lipoprotein PorW/SprE n=1 Tax=Polaribacter sp. KT 15 TaxID=1896175 RepID=UPI00090AD093|nr:tetratricopeptide repeat protein [Polaribacter sp. KT 15]SHM93425.1 protein involved in gliding motility SprE [Polaribacter sp. KT 15]